MKGGWESYTVSHETKLKTFHVCDLRSAAFDITARFSSLIHSNQTLLLQLYCLSLRHSSVARMFHMGKFPSIFTYHTLTTCFLHSQWNPSPPIHLYLPFYELIPITSLQTTHDSITMPPDSLWSGQSTQSDSYFILLYVELRSCAPKRPPLLRGRGKKRKME